MNETAKSTMIYQFDWTEYTVFALTLLLSAFIGVYFGFIKKGQDTVSGYLFGGKQMTVFPIAMSLISSFTSGITILGVPAEIYKYGTQYMVSSLTMMGVGIVTAYVFLPVFFKLQLLSLYEYFELRFHRKVRVVISLLYTIFLLTYVPVVIYGPVIALNQVSGMDIQVLLPFICIICIFYTTVGGLKAVVWSDSLQGAIMFFSVIIVTVIGAMKVGGFAVVFQNAYEGGRLESFNFDPDPTLRMSFWSITLGVIFYWCGNTGLNPSSIQRFIALPTLRQARLSVVYLCSGCIFFIILSGVIGLVMYSYYKDCDPHVAQIVNRPDQMLPLFVMEVAGDVKGLPGMFLAGVVCASLSTMSTCLNTVAGTIYEDFIEPSLKSKVTEAQASRIIKALVVIFGAICSIMVFLIEKLGAILEISISFGGMTSGAILGLFLLGMFFPMANIQGAVWGGLSSLGVTVWIMIGYRLHMAQGHIKYPSLPVSIEGCALNLTDIIPTEDNLAELPYVFPLYKISIFYYALVGCSVVIFVGLIVSYISGPNNIEDINPDLLSPLIHRFLPEKSKKIYSNVPMNETEQQKYEK